MWLHESHGIVLAVTGVAAGTFSIVAADPAAGEVGCAVQSKYFAIGAVTPWVRAGVGAVATQAMGVVAANGQRVLEALGNEVEPALALERVLARDSGRELRQLGAVTADGRAAAFTGAECVEWAGHIVGEAFAVQGNTLVGAEALESMTAVFAETRGSLADRLLAALDAGQTAGEIGAGSRLPRSSSNGRAKPVVAARASTASATCASTIIPSRSSSFAVSWPCGTTGEKVASEAIVWVTG